MTGAAAGWKRRVGQASLSLTRFAGAKTSAYDKQRREQRDFALNAKKVNKFRRLKQRLLREGKLQPPSAPEQVRAPLPRPGPRLLAVTSIGSRAPNARHLHQVGGEEPEDEEPARGGKRRRSEPAGAGARDGARGARLPDADMRRLLARRAPAATPCPVDHPHCQACQERWGTAQGGAGPGRRRPRRRRQQ